jgi:hypothetical protein
LNTNVKVEALAAVNWMLVALSIFRHWVKARPPYTTVPLLVERFPEMLKKLLVVPDVVKL